MFRSFQILVSAIVLGIGAAGLTACGQQGPLYLPAEPAATKRATLPETLLRAGSPNAVAPAQDISAPASPAAPTTPLTPP